VASGTGIDSARAALTGPNTSGLTSQIQTMTAPATVAPIAIANGALNQVASAPAWTAPIGPTPISACAYSDITRPRK
jgi:hypothetical protein